MSEPLRRVALIPLVAPRAERAVRPSPSGTASNQYRKEMPRMTEDRVLDLPSDEESARQLAEIAAGPLGRVVASQAPAAPAQQDVLAGVPAVSAANGYTKTRLGTLVLVGNVGASRNILYKTVGGRALVEFSFAARTLGHTEPTWYRVTVWEAPETTLELIRQGTYLQLKGQAVQSQSHRTGKIFLDVTAQRIDEGPAKGEQLTVAASQAPGRGYFARLWDALRGR